MKKFLATILTICLMISMFAPMSVLAEDEWGDETIIEENTEIIEEMPSEEDSYSEETVIPEENINSILLEDGDVSVSGILPEDTVLTVTSLDELKSEPESPIVFAPMFAAKPASFAAPAMLSTNSVNQDTVTDSMVEAVENDNDKNDFLAVYDIKLTQNGNVIQPGNDYPVKVRIQGLGFSSSDPSVTLIHVLDDKNAIISGLENGTVVRSENRMLIERFGDYACILDEDVSGECIYIEVLTTENGSITLIDDTTIEFEANSFSIYVVADSGPILTVNFKQGNTVLASINVKRSDVELGVLDQVVFDPGTGDLIGNEVFKGWITEPEYSVADIEDSMNIESVRELVTQKMNTLSQNDTLDLYAMILNAYSITYTDIDRKTILYNDIVYANADEPASYIVPYAYVSEDQDSSFKGWIPDNTAYIESQPSIVKTDDEILVNHNVVFYPSVHKGHWLIFRENGNGATYTAPQFIELTDVTQAPSRQPTRTGYTFAGWYTNAEGTGSQFEFGQRISENTTLYAKWNAVSTANYTVVIWKQSVNGGEAYDFAESVSLSGNVGSTINTVVPQGNGNNRYARINGVNKEYPGFFLKSYDQNVTIAPEGSTILNVYYDRISYDVRFYYARINNRLRNNDQWEVATEIQTNQELDLTRRTTWRGTNETWSDRQNYGPSDTTFEVIGGYRYYYLTVSALYGQDISEQWPRYDGFPNIGNYQLISWWMMHSSQSWGGAGGGLDTVKGILSVMDESILGNVSNSTGNFLIARYSNSQPNVYNYKIWKELPDGFDVPVDEITHQPKATTVRNGIRYFLDDTLIAKANSGPGGIHQPAYLGFLEDSFTYRTVRNFGDGRYEYDVEMYYFREKYEILYCDGTYYYNGNPLDTSKQGTPLYEKQDIYYGSDIHTSATDYTPPANEKYVFAGWYTDEGCTHEAVFTTLPTGGMTVYAKWLEKEYRIFLHPNTNAPSLDMGSQSTSFRIVHGSDINGGEPIIARRDDQYTLIGWYMDEACTKPFNFAAYVVNDTTAHGDYPLDTTRPTELDKYGDPLPGQENYNKDRDPNLEGGVRFWVTGCLDLYAKWRKDIEGADGIDVVYDPGDGTNAPTDDLKYLDQSIAISGHASIPNSEEKRFAYWQIMKWDENTNSYIPAGKSNVYPGDVYTIDIDCCRKQPVEGENDRYTYTMKLQAVYIDKNKEYTTVVFDANGGNFAIEGNPAYISREYEIGDFITFPADPIRTDYEFLGWADTNNATEANIVNRADYWAADNVHTFGWNESEGKNYIYAVWKPLKVSITISKTGMQSGERSIFDIYEIPDSGDPVFITQVSLNGASGDPLNPNSVIVNGLTAGLEYRVIERNDWSWRYTVKNSDTGTSATITHTITSDPDNDNNKYPFENVLSNPYWIDSYDYKQNEFE